MRSAVKASAAKANGVKANDEKHLRTHQIVDQAIDVRESGGPDNNYAPLSRAHRPIGQLSLFF